MSNETASAQPHPHDTIPGFRLLQTAAFVAFTLLACFPGFEIAHGSVALGLAWLLPAVAIGGYVAADFVSGFVHFLADNFGSPETPFFGKAFVQPFRGHHSDPHGILQHRFIAGNGNNCLAALPILLFVFAFVPIRTSRVGLLFGTFSLCLSVAILLTNQFQKWAHMPAPPAALVWLQRWGLILSREHHDVHHQSPFDTHYCITTGWWNPLLRRARFFETITAMITRATTARR